AFLGVSVGVVAGRGSSRVFAGAIVLVLACAALASRISIDTSLKREFSRRDPVSVDDTAVNASFAGTSTLVLLVEGQEEGALEDPAIIRAIYDLERRMEAEPGVGRATSYVDFLHTIHIAMTADQADAGPVPAAKDLAAQY